MNPPLEINVSLEDLRSLSNCAWIVTREYQQTQHRPLISRPSSQ